MAFRGFIRQGATHKVVVGPAVAVGDGYTPVTNLDISTADEAEAILHDNGTVVDISGYTWAAIATADGYYHLTLQSGISGTVGHLTIVINDDSLCLPLETSFQVIDTVPYDETLADAATGIQGVIETNNLDHICKVTTGVAADGDLSNHVVDGTILSHIMTAGADTSDYQASTDSLEAIESTSDVQTVLETNNLDHLCKTTTGVAADGDLTNHVADGTILSHIMTLGADTSTYNASTDSLEGFRNHVGDGTNLTEAGGDGDHLTEAGGDGDHLVEAGGTGDQLTAVPASTTAGTLSSVAQNLMIDRIYTRLFHEVNVTDATGASAIRNAGDSGDIATGSITDDDTTTSQAKWTWA